MQVKYAAGAEASGYAWWLFQEALPTLDERFGFVFSLVGGQMQLTGIFLGQPAEAAQLLDAAGLLDSTILDPATVFDAQSSDELLLSRYPYGVQLQEKSSFMDIVIESTIFSWTGPGMNMPTPWDEGFTGSEEQVQFLQDILTGTTRIVGGAGYNAFQNVQARLVGLLPQEAIAAIGAFVEELAADCAASNFTSLACMSGVTGHVLGGAYMEKESNASAYPHRSAYFVLDGGTQAPTELMQYMPPQEVAKALGYADKFLAVLKPYLGKRDAAYVNYLQPALHNWQTAYFGGNYRRLQRVKRRFDPVGVFSKPYTVEVPQTPMT